MAKLNQGQLQNKEKGFFFFRDKTLVFLVTCLSSHVDILDTSWVGSGFATTDYHSLASAYKDIREITHTVR